MTTCELGYMYCILESDISRPQKVKDDVLNNATGGIGNLASYRRVPGAGHLVRPHYMD